MSITRSQVQKIARILEESTGDFNDHSASWEYKGDFHSASWEHGGNLHTVTFRGRRDEDGTYQISASKHYISKVAEDGGTYQKYDPKNLHHDYDENSPRFAAAMGKLATQIAKTAGPGAKIRWDSGSQQARVDQVIDVDDPRYNNHPLKALSPLEDQLGHADPPGNLTGLLAAFHGMGATVYPLKQVFVPHDDPRASTDPAGYRIIHLR